jgi:hypothetical protein
MNFPSQHVLGNLNSKNYHSTLAALAQIINIFNPNIFEILIFTKTIFFGEGK